MAKDDEDVHRKLLLWGRMKRTSSRVAHFPSSFQSRLVGGLAEASGGLRRLNPSGLPGSRALPKRQAMDSLSVESARAAYVRDTRAVSWL